MRNTLTIAAAELRRYWLVFVGTIAVAVLVPLIGFRVSPGEIEPLPVAAFAVGVWALVALVGNAYSSLGSTISARSLSFDLSAPHRILSTWSGRILAVLAILAGNLAILAAVALVSGDSTAREFFGPYLVPTIILLTALGAHYGLLLRARHPMLFVELTILGVVVWALTRAARRYQLATNLDADLFFGVFFSVIALGILAASYQGLRKGRANLRIAARTSSTVVIGVYLGALLIILLLHYFTTPRPDQMTTIRHLGNGWVAADGYDPGRLGARSGFIITPEGSVIESSYHAPVVMEDLLLTVIDRSWYVISPDGSRRELKSLPAAGVQQVVTDSVSKRAAALQAGRLLLFDLPEDRMLRTVNFRGVWPIAWPEAGLFGIVREEDSIESVRIDPSTGEVSRFATLDLERPIRYARVLGEELAVVTAGQPRAGSVVWNFVTGETIAEGKPLDWASPEPRYPHARLIGGELIAPSWGTVHVIDPNSRDRRKIELGEGVVHVVGEAGVGQILATLDPEPNSDSLSPQRLFLVDLENGAVDRVEGDYLAGWYRGSLYQLHGSERTAMRWDDERGSLIPIFRSGGQPEG